MADIRVRVGQQNAVKVLSTSSPGTQGVQGTLSAQGISGAFSGQGVQGTQGIQGNQGLQGVQATQGTQGSTGSQGAQGSTGSQGAQGVQGRDGSYAGQGVQGLQGTVGFQGTQGLGAQGISGSFSGQGVQGTRGEGLGGDISASGINITGVITATNFVGFASGLIGITIGKTYYVGIEGDDTINTGDGLNKPFLTLKKALGVSTVGDNIRIGAGIFAEEFPLTVPQGVSITGSGIRGTFIQPTEATKQNDCFLLNGETEVTDLTIGYMYEPGWAFRFAPNMKTNMRSPYIQRVTVLNRGTGITTSDPYGFDTPHNPPTSYKGGRGCLIDGSVVDPSTLEPAMLFNECTFITPNNTALEMTNGARTEWVNCFSYFADKAIYGHSGEVGLGSTGKTRLKISGITTNSEPAANDLVYLFRENTVNGTYSITGSGTTITHNSHGLSNSDRVYLNFPASNDSLDGIYSVSGVTSNTFNVSATGVSSTGSLGYKTALGYGTIHSYSNGVMYLTNKGSGTFSTASSRSGKQVGVYGNAKISTSQYKFGGSSGLFDGDGDYLQIVSDTDFGFSTDDFTLECFIRIDPDYVPLSTVYQSIIDLRNGTTTDISPSIALRREYNFMTITVTSNIVYRLNSVDVILGSTNLSTGVWHHVALSRNSGTTRLFLNGTLQGTYLDSNDYGTAKPVRISANPAGADFYRGNIDEIRISDNARYISTFTPTVAAFSSDENTKLLLHCNGDNDSIVFTDSTLVLQDVRIVSPVGLGTTNILSANKITLADYQQFGADMRSIGSAAVFGNTGITADGLGVNFRLFAFNFGHIGTGKDFSQDESLVVQSDEVIEFNGANVSYVSIDQRGDFRVGSAFYVNESDGYVTFSNQTLSVTSYSNLDITDGTNTASITPSSISVGNVQISTNQVTTTSGELSINPSGISSTRVVGDLNVDGGNVFVGVSTAYGLVLTSPNGTKYRLIVDNSGALSTVPV